jgi:hypothetical protein
MTLSISNALSFGKGLGILFNSTTAPPPAPLTEMMKLPLPGFSPLISQAIPAAFNADSTFKARVLNAFQLLHASISTLRIITLLAAVDIAFSFNGLLLAFVDDEDADADDDDVFTLLSFVDDDDVFALLALVVDEDAATDFTIS